jgi:hypothetical protein
MLYSSTSAFGQRCSADQLAQFQHDGESSETGSGSSVAAASFQGLMDAAPVRMIRLSSTDTLCTWFNKPWLEFDRNGQSSFNARKDFGGKP